jgi:hypothetical protein
VRLAGHEFEVSTRLLALRLAQAGFDLGATTSFDEARHAAVGGAFRIRVANVGVVAMAYRATLRLVVVGESFAHGIDGREHRNRLVERVHR